MEIESKPPTLADIVKAHILAVYAKHNNNKYETARELDISLKTLYNKLAVYGNHEARRRSQANGSR